MNAAAREVEAILLVSGRPVSVRALAAAAERPKEEIEAAISALEARYSPESSGIVLRRVGGGFHFATNPETSDVIERFRREARPSPLSSAAHEVLASVLYLGPMTRAAVAKVRGVNSDAVVRSLIERGLITESGFDADAPGTPALLDLTEEFHTASGSSNRADFPPLESLVSEEELDRVRDRIVAPDNAPGHSETPSGEDGGESGQPHETPFPGESVPDGTGSRETMPDAPFASETASGETGSDGKASGESMSSGASGETEPDGIVSEETASDAGSGEFPR